MTKKWVWCRVALALALVGAGGCLTVGPDYEPPSVEMPDVWQQSALADYGTNAVVMTQWWRVYQDETLNALVERARAGNLSLQVAVERIVEARARRGLANAQYFPAIDGTGVAAGIRDSEALAPNLPAGRSRQDTYFSLGVDVAWELDLWGRIRRSVESADAAIQATVEDARDTMMLLYAEVAGAYIEARALQVRIARLTANIQAQQETLQLTQDRHHAGLVPVLDVSQAQLNLAQTQAGLPPLRKSLSAALNRVAVLVGDMPGQVNALFGETIEVPTPPPAVAVGLPAELLRRRPDIRAAERLLAAQHARIGATQAELYPTFALPGTFALQAYDAGDLVSGGSLSYSFGPAFRWSLFSGGRIRSAVRAEESVTQQALLAYRQTVLLAVEEVENAMVSLARERERIEALTRAVAAAEKSVGLVKDLYRNGLANFQNVLDMERSLVSQQDALASSQGLLGQSLALLYKSLGGGWTLAENTVEPVADDVQVDEKED